ncbi:hypothetical protein CLIM01_07509 [Colletotrichum limetticola]|uniref:Uncharacterized protein n=1 Tax=Colletotrichum limetticola TaxID=1209924 RepID=A0ABQ9PUB6_9PEZI|nr:hypothetical protein CLIM01_07509 [Colletotrichum limetticola]
MHTPHATICRQRLPLQRNPLPMHSLVFRCGLRAVLLDVRMVAIYTTTDECRGHFDSLYPYDYRPPTELVCSVLIWPGIVPGS